MSALTETQVGTNTIMNYGFIQHNYFGFYFINYTKLPNNEEKIYFKYYLKIFFQAEYAQNKQMRKSWAPIGNFFFGGGGLK